MSAKAEPGCFFLSLQNVTANHRANDVIAAEDGPQVLVGRFMYGPLDMVALTGEKVPQGLSISSLAHLPHVTQVHRAERVIGHSTGCTPHSLNQQGIRGM